MAVLSGLIAAAGAVGAGAIAAGGAKSAAKTSAAAADKATEAQTQIYAQNKELLSPYVQQGLPATAQINALLGLSPTPQSYGQPTYSQEPMNALGGYPMTEDWSNINPTAMNGWEWGRTINAPMAPTQGTVGTTVSPQQAFDNFRNYTGYQFRLGEGMKAINSGFAGKGLLQSGAALKSLNNYGQGMASQEFGSYLNALGNQQSMGLSAAQATAGVGSGYANSLGNIAMANGANQANAQLAGASAMGGALNSLGTGLSGILGQQMATNSAVTRLTTPIAPVAVGGGLQPLSGGYGGW